MERGKLKANIVYNIIYQASTYITPLATATYIGRILGAKRIGRYSFAQSIVSYFVLFATLGTTYYGQREIAKAQKQALERSNIFYEVVLLRLFNTVIAFTAFNLIIVPGSVDPSLYAIAAIEILSVGVDISWFFQGMENFGVIALTNCVTRVISVVLIILFVRTQDQLNLYALLYCATLVVGFASQWLFLRGKVVLGVKPSIRNEKKHLKIAVRLFVAQAAIQVYTVLDKTMIGLITRSEIQNGYYEQTQKLIRILVVVSTSVGTVMASRIANLWGEKKTEEIREMIALSFRVVCCISLPIFTGMQICAHAFVPWFFGNGFEGVEPLLRILIILPLVIGLSSVVGMQFFVPTGKERYLTLSVIAGSVVNFILNYFFIHQWAAIGASIASVVAEIVVTLIQFYLARKHVGINQVPGIMFHYLKYCIPMAAIGYVVQRLTAQISASVVIVICACGITYLIQLVVFRDPLVEFIRKKRELTNEQ